MECGSTKTSCGQKKIDLHRHDSVFSTNPPYLYLVSITYNWGRKGTIRNFLYQLRKKRSQSRRQKVWEQTARQIFADRNYAAHVPLFTSIELETRTRCNSACSFCAANVLTDTREDKYMSEATYLKILEDLAKLKYTGRIKFFVNNEPLLDARTPEFIRLAKEKVPGCWTEVHSNGLKLNPKTGKPLLEAGLDLLYINNYTQEQKMHGGVKRFLEETAPDFPQTQIVFHMRLLEEKLLNRGGTSPNQEAVPEPLPIPCILPFDEMVVTADGRVSICCQDHFFEERMGNVNHTSLDEIWFGERFAKMREKLVTGDRSGSKFCQACDFRGFKEEHMTKGQSIRNRMIGDLWG